METRVVITDPEARRDYVRALRASGTTLQDIGDAMGVSRERVRQLCVGGSKTRGVSSGEARHLVDPLRLLAACRAPGITSVKQALDALGYSTGQCHAILQQLGVRDAVRRLHRWRVRAAIRQRTTSLLLGFAAEHGRTPTIREIKELCGWNPDKPGVSARGLGFQSLAAMWRYVGLVPNHVGSHGHLAAVRARSAPGRPHAAAATFANRTAPDDGSAAVEGWEDDGAGNAGNVYLTAADLREMAHGLIEAADYLDARAGGHPSGGPQT